MSGSGKTSSETRRPEVLGGIGDGSALTSAGLSEIASVGSVALRPNVSSAFGGIFGAFRCVCLPTDRSETPRSDPRKVNRLAEVRGVK